MYADKDIVLEFASLIYIEVKLNIIKKFERLKDFYKLIQIFELLCYNKQNTLIKRNSLSMKEKYICDINKRAWLEVNLDFLHHNFNAIRGEIKNNEMICCVIKANAYGHGAVEVGKLYEKIGAHYLAVSNIQEALQLRKNGVNLPVLVLGYTPINCANLLDKYQITQTIYSYEYGVELAKVALKDNLNIKIHFKIDTGMGRIGFIKEDIDKIVLLCNISNFIIEGIFTHFSVSDLGEEGKGYTDKQFAIFKEVIEKLSERNINFKIKHCCNSGGILDYQEYHLDMVRAGIILYGLKPSNKVSNYLDLKPALSLHSIISHIKDVEAGQSIGYERNFIADRKMKIATVPIGYADGFRRNNGKNNCYVSINNCKVPIVGGVCMDQLMVDVTGVDCKVGDEVILFGKDKSLSVDELGKLNNTNNYETICNISKRVPIAYISKGKIVKWQNDLLNDETY